MDGKLKKYSDIPPGKFFDQNFSTPTGRQFSKMLAEHGRWKGEAILYRKDATQVIMEASTITLRDANGLITGYVSVHRDIAERKQVEADLYKSEELLRLGYDTANLGIWQNNLVTGMVHFDDRARAQYGSTQIMYHLQM